MFLSVMDVLLCAACTAVNGKKLQIVLRNSWGETILRVKVKNEND